MNWGKDMVNRLVRSVRSFFGIERNDARGDRRIRYGTRPGMDIEPPIKVRGTNTKNGSITDTLERMSAMSGIDSMKVIESGKATLFVPLEFTDLHIEHVLMCSGYQKVPIRGGGTGYDPRLIQAVKLGINMYSAQVNKRVEGVVDLLDESPTIKRVK